MATIVTRSGKGSPLTHAEVDANFTNLNTDKLELSGGTMTGNLSFGDNDKAIFGAGSDLQIYHDGSNSYVRDVGTGVFLIQGDSDIWLQNSTGTASYARFTNGGAATLYNNNNAKLATTSTGVDITGTLTSDGLTNSGTSQFDGSVSLGVAGVSNAFLNTPSSLYVSIDSDDNSTNRVFELQRNSTDGTGSKLLKADENGDISFYEDTGTTAKFFWDASAESLGIGTSSPDKNLHIEAEPPVFRMTNLQGTSSLGLSMGKIEWETRDSSAPGVIAHIDVVDSNNFGTTFDMAFATGQSGSAIERMRIDSSGNVGIGTSSPATKLDVNGDGLAIRIDGTANTSRGIILRNTGTAEGQIQTDGNMHFIQEDAGKYMRFSTANTERMRIDSSGNVGIGTSSPAVKLHTTSGVARTSTAKTETAFFATDDIDDYRFGLVVSHKGGATGADRYASIDSASYQVSTDTFSASSSLVLQQLGGNVGIGTSSLGYTGFADNLTIADSSNGGLTIRTGASAQGAIYFSDTTGDVVGQYAGFLVYNQSSNHMAFGTSSTERMRIDSSGNLLVGTTSTDIIDNSPADTSGIVLNSSGSIYTSVVSSAHYLTRRTTDGDIVVFRKDGTTVGSISVTGSTTSYNTSSDYRLKTDAQPMTGASARVQALNPVNFEWVADGTRVDGFLAHEAQAVVPEAVTGTKDAMMDEEYEITPAVEATYDEDGNVLTEAISAVIGTRSVPDYQGIDQSKLVPLLTAALQEALTKIDDIETRLTALEGA